MTKTTIIFLLIVILFFFNSCQPSISIPELKNKHFLLYVEDIDGKGGSFDGDFGDIVLFDLDFNKQYFVTEDKLFDYNPVYCRKFERIYFDSKRGKSNSQSGLTTESHIYFLDLKSNKIEMVDKKEIYTKNSDILITGINTPLIESSGKKLFFVGNQPNQYKFSTLYKSTKEMDSIRILFSNLNLSSNILYHEESKSIYYDDRSSTELTDKTKSIYLIKLSDSNKVEMVISHSNNHSSLGDVKYNKVIYTTIDYNRNATKSLRIYDLKQQTEIFNKKIDDIGFSLIKSPVFNDSTTIYFIGRLLADDSKVNEDIYEYNFRTGNLSQITTTHNIKDKLKYYSNK